MPHPVPAVLLLSPPTLQLLSPPAAPGVFHGNWRISASLTGYRRVIGLLFTWGIGGSLRVSRTSAGARAVVSHTRNRLEHLQHRLQFSLRLALQHPDHLRSGVCRIGEC